MAARNYDDNDPLTRALLSLKSAITASTASSTSTSGFPAAVASPAPAAAAAAAAMDQEDAAASRQQLSSQLLSSGRMKQTGRPPGGRGEVRASDILGMKKFSGHMLWLRVQKARLGKGEAGDGGGGGVGAGGAVSDFSSGDPEQQVDKRKLQQLWQYLPEKERRQWNAKAARLMRQAARIGARSFGANSAPNPRQLADHRVDEAVKRLASERRRLQLQMEKGKLGRFTALDVAAYLKLLGDSLQALGLRLQRATSVSQAGSMAVISDSLLCSLVCLHCLATQVPGIAEAVDVAEAADSLDNCAFFMPGLAGPSG